MRKKIFVVSNTSWYLYNFRLRLMQTLQDYDYEVWAVTPYDSYSEKIKSYGIAHVSIPINRSGTNPVEDIALICRFYRLFRKQRPDIILSYTIKPNIYASIAAASLKISYINNISGLGTAFIKAGIITKIVKRLYKLALLKSHKVFFENRDDLKLFLEERLVSDKVVERIPGSGINAEKFSPLPMDDAKDCFIFLLVARMLWDKGVGEFVQAARILKAKYSRTECQLLGFLDFDNVTAITCDQIQRWVHEGVISYLGEPDSVIEFINKADCIVLPSYREGIPRSLLEAASLAKPIITTDTVGCKEVVDNGVNGYLCRVKDALDLAHKMELMIKLPAAERILMGQRGRQKIAREFDEEIVIQRYLETIKLLT